MRNVLLGVLGISGILALSACGAGEARPASVLSAEPEENPDVTGSVSVLLGDEEDPLELYTMKVESEDEQMVNSAILFLAEAQGGREVYLVLASATANAEEFDLEAQKAQMLLIIDAETLELVEPKQAQFAYQPAGETETAYVMQGGLELEDVSETERCLDITGTVKGTLKLTELEDKAVPRTLPVEGEFAIHAGG